MRTLHLLPEGPSYSLGRGADAIRSEGSGGAGRYRRDFLGATLMLNATWNLNREQYQYMQAFYNTATRQGSEPFKCSLLVDDAFEYTEHVCYMMPNTWKLNFTQGWNHNVSVVLEVEPLDIDDDANDAIMNSFEASLGFQTYFQSLLQEIVNDVLPGVGD